MEQYFVTVRDLLRISFGDHMVASTILAKRLVTIALCFEHGIPAEACARGLWNTGFAGNKDYEGRANV